MAGKVDDKIVAELFEFAREIMYKFRIYPYVSFVVRNGVVVARGYNRERETRDVSQQGDVVAIRNAQEALDTGDLTGYFLYSFFEPTILGFDLALWSGIRNFIWCINSTSLPRFYNKLKYNPQDYLKNHPNEITIGSGIREPEALDLVKKAKEDRFYPDNLY